MNDNNPFDRKPVKRVNPRFSLGGASSGMDTSDFDAKPNVPVRASRPAPRPIGAQDEAPAPVFGDAPVAKKSSENSLFAFDEDEVILDVGVDENSSVDSDSGASKGIKTGLSGTASSGFMDVDADTGEVLSLDVGVEDDEFTAVNTLASSDTEPGVPVSQFEVSQNDEDDILSLDVGVDETSASGFGSDDEDGLTLDVGVDDVELMESPPVGTPSTSQDATSEDDVTTLDVGVDETVERQVMGSSASEMLPVEQPVVDVPVKKTAPSGRRLVNPLFADPSPDVDDSDDINLDVGVNDAGGESVPKRQMNARFDFKSDRKAPKAEDPDRLPEWKKPNALIEVADAEEFKKEKNKRTSKKSQNTGKRGFQIQIRDITLLRFLTKYQFSYVDALARVLDSTPNSINNRLRTLEDYDLVKRQVLAAGATLWQPRKAGIELAGMNFTENKKVISFATVRHTVGLVNLAAELEREAAGGKDVLGLQDRFGEPFPVENRFPGGIRLYGEEALNTPLTFGEMTISEREIRQGQKRYRGGRSSAEMRDAVELAISSGEAPELEEGNEGLFVVYGSGGQTGEHVPDLVVTRPRNADGSPNHFAVELELTAKSPSDWKRILRSYRDAGGMYSRIIYFTPDRPIANMIKNADEEVGLGPDRLILRKYTPKNKRQPFLG